MARVSARRRITPEERDLFRQELIDIARRIFLEEGYAAVTIRRVTAEAGVTAMAFYWYFDCKDALLTVIWDGLIHESAEVCEDSARQAPSDQQALRYFTAFIDFWLAQRAHFRFIFLNDSPTTDFVQLRRQLFTMGGVKRHFEQYDRLLTPLFAGHADAPSRVEQLRTLSMYRAFGFLYCVVCIYDHDAAETAVQRRLILDEMQRCLTHWCTH